MSSKIKKGSFRGALQSPQRTSLQMHLKGVLEGRSKLKDKDKIASPSARNDTLDSAGNDISGKRRGE